jgi:hypothetical protein
VFDEFGRQVEFGRERVVARGGFEQLIGVVLNVLVVRSERV